MATIGEVAAALASTINTATGLRTVDHVPESVDPPVLFVAFDRLEVITMSRGAAELWFDAVVFTARAVSRVGQELLYEYLSTSGPKSIIKAVADASTLGLDDVSASAVSAPARALGAEEMAGYGYFGGVVPVRVVTDGA